MGIILKDLLTIAENILSDAGDTDCKKDAEMLLCHVIRYDAKKVFMNWTREIDDGYCEEYLELVSRRADGTPLQYLTNEQGFMGHIFYVDERVLIPRQDTEILAETAEEYIKSKSVKTVLDLCTGSGVLACHLAKRFANLKVTASDIDADALAVAVKNADRLGVSSRIKFVKSDIFSSFKKGFGGQRFDLIVSNPPYIPTADIMGLQKEIVDHEPMRALDGGEDGLDYYRQIIGESPAYLKKRGELLLEIGYDQASAVKQIIADTGAFQEPELRQDLGGNDRVVLITLNN